MLVKMGVVAAVPTVTQGEEPIGTGQYAVYLPGADEPLQFLPEAAGTLRFNIGDPCAVLFVNDDPQMPVIVDQGYGTQLDNSTSQY